MKKQILLTLMTAFLLIICISGIFALTPTSKWKDFYGNAIGGKVGDVITAKDPQGVICGQYTIKTAGYYGFLHCYADDPSTSVDEGAKAGDNITFYFNNNIVGSGIWDNNKDIINVNLTLVKCNENWKCSAWSGCINSTQTRTCTDSNKCGTTSSKPAETQSCKCVENWKCTAFSRCINSTQTRTCVDNNLCGTVSSKPAETQSCKCVENWKCSSWSKCINGVATRTCTDQNLCGTVKSKPAETNKCTAFFWNLFH